MPGRSFRKVVRWLRSMHWPRRGRRIRGLAVLAPLAFGGALACSCLPLAATRRWRSSRPTFGPRFRSRISSARRDSPGPRFHPAGVTWRARSPADGGRAQLAVFDVEKPGPPKVVAGFDDVDVYELQWVNDERLVFDAPRSPIRQHRQIDSRRDCGRSTATAASYRQLIKASQLFQTCDEPVPADRTLPWKWRLHSVLGDGSNDVLVQG